MWVPVKGMYSTVSRLHADSVARTPRHFPSCSCAKGALHLGKAHCAEQVESAGSGQHEPAAKQNLGGLASGALMCTKPGVGA